MWIIIERVAGSVDPRDSYFSFSVKPIEQYKTHRFRQSELTCSVISPALQGSLFIYCYIARVFPDYYRDRGQAVFTAASTS